MLRVALRSRLQDVDLLEETGMNSDPGSLSDLVDLARYPITENASGARRELIERCRSDMETSGACQLPGFLSANASVSLAQEASSLAHLAYYQDDQHNAYFEEAPESLPEDDSRRLMQHSSSAAVAWDQIPASSGLRRLYDSDALLEFIGAALGKEPLYRNEDPLGACTVVVYREGDELGWHFDNAEFAVTLMLQKAETGGEFEYVPMIRSPEDESYPRVQELLLGSRDEVINFPSDPGTLALFRGQFSIHRVSPILGARPRLNVVFAYADRPGAKLSPYTQQLFYGRTA
jgi:hypothetical protein